MIPEITIPQEQIAAFCRKHHIRKLSLFGSVLRDDFRDDSDIDVLVEFEPDARVGLMEMSRMQDELSELMGGREVDLVTAGFLNHRIRDRILASAQVHFTSPPSPLSTSGEGERDDEKQADLVFQKSLSTYGEGFRVR